MELGSKLDNIGWVFLSPEKIKRQKQPSNIAIWILSYSNKLDKILFLLNDTCHLLEEYVKRNFLQINLEEICILFMESPLSFTVKEKLFYLPRHYFQQRLKRQLNQLGPHLIKCRSLVRIFFSLLVWTCQKKKKKKQL